ncbi:MAG: response regulator [Ktedonobacterales bacterium]|nr:response regulator [Ktedonobacterales bacterium]
MITILLADDSDAIRQAYRFILEDNERAYRIEEARTQREAVQHLRNSAEPLVVLLDAVMLPDGANLFTTLAAEPHLLDRHYIIITTTKEHLNLPPELLERALPVLMKPFDLEDFSRLIDAGEAQLEQQATALILQPVCAGRE